MQSNQPTSYISKGMTTTKGMATALALIALSSLIPSQANPVGSNPIIDCQFTRSSDQYGINQEALDLKFEIDPQGPAGFLIESSGAIKEVKLIYKGNGAVFIDESSTGEVFVTSIDRHLNAVHSSHRVSLQGSLFAKQYYGRCSSNKPWS
ncbi:hypothetical protein [Motilimonas eburnea]|uniref:hypothetical protein n=1 Tax=Motilimonas eburnea TaxID=1737488 RepID=UPI001E509E0B|nr:hypothetical protein [Motilimonas eburnea]MCE2570960.1 hypothetical protein [Motilimonas eburnea]